MTLELPIQEFALYLRTLRKSRGMSQRELCRQAGISSAYLCQIERGDRNIPGLEILLSLARALSVSEEEMLERARLTPQKRELFNCEVIERAFHFVCCDPKFKFGLMLEGSRLTWKAKAYIVEVYQTASGRTLLLPEELLNLPIQETIPHDDQTP